MRSPQAEATTIPPARHPSQTPPAHIGLVFIGHGRSDDRAIVSSLRVAREAARSGMLEALREVASSRVTPQPLSP